MAAQPRKVSEQTERGGETESWLPLVAVLIGLWAIIPPYIKTFGDLGVEMRVEVADHVIPGIVVAAVGVVGYFLLRSADPPQLALFVMGAVIALAGFWMVSTHIGLIRQAREEIVPWGAVLWHGIPGLAVTLLGVVWTIRFWGTEPDEAPSGR